MHEAQTRTLFEVFKETGIIEQLTRTLLEERLPEGLISPHFAVLNHLINQRDGAVPIDMARAFQVPKTSMTHTLKGLVARGMVELHDNPDDGRSKTVWLTDSGRGLVRETIEQLAPDFEKLLSAIELEKLAAILPTLVEVREIMDAARDAG